MPRHYALALIYFLLLPMFGVRCYAQEQKVPIITLGRIPHSDIKDGKPIPTLSTRQQVLKYGLLLADVNNCRVTEYKCTIIAPGRPLYGPIYVSGAELTNDIKGKIKALDGPGVKLYIEDIKMNYRGSITDAAPIAITYDN